MCVKLPTKREAGRAKVGARRGKTLGEGTTTPLPVSYGIWGAL